MICGLKRGRSSAVSRPRRAKSGSADLGRRPEADFEPFFSPDFCFFDPNNPLSSPLLLFSFFFSFFNDPV